ncbi:hypothetical protein GCK72_015835 [Caenorhabditis remanei]|uniref:F-box domain-containing protein n=1 Tax=Caenorhabditis remanei TaxID=31234 RepID=A0A6A5GV72_CAERE|nr:hypothetical protein GCK72_015835 [Caenorhabditis remanei]KAF1759368.1 hypothetical protein GCK72_015835 [Caenorhabditis remanei]
MPALPILKLPIIVLMRILKTIDIDTVIFFKTSIGSLRIGRAGIWKSGVTENERMSERTVNTVKINRLSMPALPILKLPIIVLMKILRTIDIDTVILISLCSRKMYHLVKNFRDKSVTPRIEIYGRDSYVRVVTPNNYFYEVDVMSRTSEKSGTLERMNINGHLVPIERSRKHHHVWETYWDDKVEGLYSVMEYISDLFGIKNVTKITVSLDTMRLLDVLKERQRNVFELATRFRLNEKESHLILDNYPAKILRISGLPDNFPIGKYLQTVNSLCVASKVSITLDDLLNMNCVDLFLSRNRFTGTEIERLLQHWAIGGFKRLKYLELDVEDLNMEDVLGELTHSRMTENKTYKSNIGYYSFSDRLITRNDGVVASFQYDQQYRRVQFAVWPDSEGNEY